MKRAQDGGHSLSVYSRSAGVAVDRLALSEQKAQFKYGTGIGAGTAKGREIAQTDIGASHQGAIGLEDFRRVCAGILVVVKGKQALKTEIPAHRLFLLAHSAGVSEKHVRPS